MQRKYLITKEDVNLIYDLIAMPERTMSEKLDKLQKMQQFTHRLEEAEVSPWTDCIYPWENDEQPKTYTATDVQKANIIGYWKGHKEGYDEAVADAGKEIRHE